MDYFKFECDKTTLQAVKRIIAMAEERYGKKWAAELKDLLFKQIKLDIKVYELETEGAKDVGFTYGIACRPICNLLCKTVTQAMTNDWKQKVWVLDAQSSQAQIVCSVEHWCKYIENSLNDTKENSKLHPMATTRAAEVLSALRKFQ